MQAVIINIVLIVNVKILLHLEVKFPCVKDCFDMFCKVWKAGSVLYYSNNNLQEAHYEACFKEYRLCWCQ